MGFLHGAEVVEVNSGPRPITVGRSSVIGLVGTAPKGPVNVPTLISGSRTDGVSTFGDGVGTVPDALDGIFDQVGAMVVVINVLDPTVHFASEVAKEYTLGSDDTLTLDYKYMSNVVVTNQGATVTYVAGTDYTHDPDTGKITRIATGAIAAGETLSIAGDRPDETAVTDADIIGAVDATTGAYTGIQALLGAEAETGVRPKLLIAPSYTASVTMTVDDVTGAPVTTAMSPIADQLRATIIADGPNTNDNNAIQYRDLFGSRRVYVVDPFAKVYDSATDSNVSEASSARVAGLIARNDNERGYWTSPSNVEMYGIVGTDRPIDFIMGDENSRANLLNENEVATIIRQNGYRLWGNRTCSSDPKWAFLSHVRLHDIIMEALQMSHQWAVDRNITKTYVDDVAEGINAFLADLTARNVISGGKAWFDPAKNTATTMESGLAYWNVEYGRYGVGENLIFEVAVNNDYTVDRLAA